MVRAGEASVACHWHTSSRPPGCNLQTDRHQQKTAAPHGRTLSSPVDEPDRTARPPRPPVGSPDRPHPSVRARHACPRATSCPWAAQTTVAVPHARRSGGEEARALPVSRNGAQRASGHRTVRLAAMTALAAVLAVGGLTTHPQVAEAAGRKVVIVVGPVGSQTSSYIAGAKRLAAQARSYGATVYQVYSPHATWSRVRSVSQGANLFIYLGHGNGWPSPYGPFQRYTKDGLGLNASDGSSRVKYYGEYYVDRYLNFAPNSVVILNRLCYASGNNEWGSGYPTKATAIKRVDNFGAGFLRTGARAVFAEGVDNPAYILSGLFKSTKTIKQIFFSDPARDMRWDFSFRSTRTPGKVGLLDPTDHSNHDDRSVIGDLGM